MARSSLVTGLLIGLIALLTTACDASTEGVTSTSDETTTSEQEASATTEATTTTSEAETTTTADETTTTVGPAGEFTDGQFTTEGYPNAGEPVFLTNVDVEAYENFDRVVFHFDGEVSDLSYQIEPVTEESLSNAEGKPMDVEGEILYEISLAPASGVDLSAEEPIEMYVGPDSFTPEASTSTISELAISEDFEGLMNWVIGVDESAVFAHDLNVSEGELVVDFGV